LGPFFFPSLSFLPPVFGTSCGGCHHFVAPDSLPSLERLVDNFFGRKPHLLLPPSHFTLTFGGGTIRHPLDFHLGLSKTNLLFSWVSELRPPFLVFFLVSPFSKEAARENIGLPFNSVHVFRALPPPKIGGQGAPFSPPLFRRKPPGPFGRGKQPCWQSPPNSASLGGHISIFWHLRGETSFALPPPTCYWVALARPPHPTSPPTPQKNHTQDSSVTLS